MGSPAPPSPGSPPDLPARIGPPFQDSVYIFQEGALPPYRQMFYQFCDLNVEEYVPAGHRGGDRRARAQSRKPQGPKGVLPFFPFTSAVAPRDGEPRASAAGPPLAGLTWHAAAAFWGPHGPPCH